jgi:hypothetical protein
VLVELVEIPELDVVVDVVAVVVVDDVSAPSYIIKVVIEFRHEGRGGITCIKFLPLTLYSGKPVVKYRVMVNNGAQFLHIQSSVLDCSTGMFAIHTLSINTWANNGAFSSRWGEFMVILLSFLVLMLEAVVEVVVGEVVVEVVVEVVGRSVGVFESHPNTPLKESDIEVIAGSTTNVGMGSVNSRVPFCQYLLSSHR